MTSKTSIMKTCALHKKKKKAVWWRSKKRRKGIWIEKKRTRFSYKEENEGKIRVPKIFVKSAEWHVNGFLREEWTKREYEWNLR